MKKLILQTIAVVIGMLLFYAVMTWLVLNAALLAADILDWSIIQVHAAVYGGVMSQASVAAYERAKKLSIPGFSFSALLAGFTVAPLIVSLFS